MMAETQSATPIMVPVNNYLYRLVLISIENQEERRQTQKTVKGHRKQRVLG